MGTARLNAGVDDVLKRRGYEDRPQLRRSRTEHQLYRGFLPSPNFDTPWPACGRLIKRSFAPHEIPSLMEAIVSNRDEVRFLGTTQTFLDVIDEARSTFVHAD